MVDFCRSEISSLLKEKMFNKINEAGWRGVSVPISHLIDLKDAIIKRYEQGLINKDFYKDQLSFFSFNPPPHLADIRSIIILAVPTPQMRITFHWKGNPVPVTVPPTYVSYTSRTDTTIKTMTKWFRKAGYNLVKSQLPLKTLAVCSGLAKYGRNNICYVPGMGSFLQFVGAFSDLPSEQDPWSEPQMLDRCKSCIACLKHCPTGAIAEDRFLLHAEICLTYINESANDFPGWINPSWHHCLVGCMKCQVICPENKAVINWFEDRAEFSEEETILFVQQVPLDELPGDTAGKIKSLQINEDFRILCRNLSMIIK
jgi:epoxyqueuosine reductase